VTWSERGFAQIPRWLLHDESITAHAKLAYVGLSSYVNREGVAIVKHSTLARTCSLSVAAVRRGVDELARLGVVEKMPRFRHGGQRANAYRIAVHQPGDNPGENDGDEA
jgi:hypothetical protein